MIGPRRRPPLQLILLVVCVGLSWLVYSELRASRDHGAGAAPAVVPRSEADQFASQPDFAMPPMQDFDMILARPLFNSNRRPIETEEPQQLIEVKTPSPLAINLKGVIVDGPKRVAIFVDNYRKTIVALKKNDQFQGWTLTEVEPQQVTFSQQDTVRQLFLEFDKK